jgi:hypothetical protein
MVRWEPQRQAVVSRRRRRDADRGRLRRKQWTLPATYSRYRLQEAP